MNTNLHISSCQFHFTCFEVVEMRRLIILVLDGGITKDIEFNNAFIHVIIGQPLERYLQHNGSDKLWDAMI